MTRAITPGTYTIFKTSRAGFSSAFHVLTGKLDDKTLSSKMSAGGGSKIHLVPSEGLVMVLDLLSSFTTLVHWCLVN